MSTHESSRAHELGIQEAHPKLDPGGAKPRAWRPEYAIRERARASMSVMTSTGETCIVTGKDETAVLFRCASDNLFDCIGRHMQLISVLRCDAVEAHAKLRTGSIDRPQNFRMIAMFCTEQGTGASLPVHTDGRILSKEPKQRRAKRYLCSI